MNNLKEYILEKFKLSKETADKQPTNKLKNAWNATLFEEGDICACNPANASKYSNAPSKGKPTFLRVLKNDGKSITFELLYTDWWYTSSTHDKGEAKPVIDKVISNKMSCKIDKDGFCYYASMVMYLFTDDSEKFYD